MDESPKDLCYIIRNVGANIHYECKICGRLLSTKQRIYTHLNKKHSKSPLKRVYKQYEDDPEIPIPKRTMLRHSSARQSLFVSDRQYNSEQELEKNHDTHSEADITHELGDQMQNEVVTSYRQYCNAFSSSEEDDIDEGDSSTESSDTDDVSSDSDLSELSDNDLSEDEMPCDDADKTVYSELELNSLCLISYFLRHNSSGVAIKDLLHLLQVLCPDSSMLKEITYEKVLSLAGETNCKAVDYCSVCNARFPENPDMFRCQTDGCIGLRYKGLLTAQHKEGRQPRSCFVLADVEKQLRFILEKKGSWDSVQYTKRRINQTLNCTDKTDISDGQFYRTLCLPGQFLSDTNNISALFNTDGIPLYNSSNVKLWPVFLAINELPPACRFARENMILAAIWQGKNKPPFSQYMCAFGQEMCKLYEDGIRIKPHGLQQSVVVRLGVFVATMDLQAKGYVLNMTMHNGAFGCSTCEESGESVKQGNGYARFYPYRSPQERPDIRDSDDVKYVKGLNATEAKRILGICGMTGLAAMPWFDVVIGVVPDYMHCVLLGVTKTLLYKFFSPTNSGKPYFVGKHLKKISKRLHGIRPPDFIERMPRNLEKNYSHFKATELQTWLLFYSLPCLNGYIEDVYLQHLALLSEGIHLLLGDNITEENLFKAETLLDSFYEQFSTLYGKGSCGLNVHNIGAHMVFYVRMWGPLWSWSCFPFEDWNAALLQSVHGTGDVTKQCLRLNEINLKFSCINLDSMPRGNMHSYLVRMKKHGKTWSTSKSDDGVSIAGALKPCGELDENEIENILNETGCQEIQSLKKSLRVQVNELKLYSEEYTRMKKRICYVVRRKNGQIRKIMYFLVNTTTNRVSAYAKKIEIHHESFICTNNSNHIIRVFETNVKEIFPVEDIVEKLIYMSVESCNYVACLPNTIGHSIFK